MDDFMRLADKYNDMPSISQSLTQIREDQEKGRDVGRQFNSNRGNALQQLWRSDPRSKENVLHVGYSPSGLNIYEFDYKLGLGPAGRYRGVMSNEIPQNAVMPRSIFDQFDAVNYAKVDVNFERLS